MKCNYFSAYQSSDIEQFQAIIKEHHSSVMGDTFIREHIEDLLKNIRTEVNNKLLVLFSLSQAYLWIGML